MNRITLEVEEPGMTWQKLYNLYHNNPRKRVELGAIMWHEFASRADENLQITVITNSYSISQFASMLDWNGIPVPHPNTPAMHHLLCVR